MAGGYLQRWQSVREKQIRRELKQQELHFRHTGSELLTEHPSGDSQGATSQFAAQGRGLRGHRDTIWDQ